MCPASFRIIIMKKFLFSALAAFALVACGEGVTPDTGSKMKVSVTPGEASATELTFTVKSEEATNCSWMCVKEGTTVPSGADIMSKGKSVFANQEVTAKASNLIDDVTYIIIAAAMNAEGDIVVSEQVKMTTLKREANPTVALSSVSVEGSSFIFTITPSEAEKCYYKVYADGATSSMDDILATGVEVAGSEEQNITVENLADGIYFVQAVAVNGEKKSISNKVTFTINTARPTFSPTITKVWVNPSLPTNGHDFIVRFYFTDPAGSSVNVSLNFDTIQNGHSYLPAGYYVFNAESGYKLIPEYTRYDNWYEFTEGYCNVSIKDSKYTFEIYLVRADDEVYYANQAFSITWTGAVENMPLP